MERKEVMDIALVMDELYKHLRGLPDFSSLKDIQYDEKYDLVRAKVGIVEKVIPINDKSSRDAIISQVMEWFARE